MAPADQRLDRRVAAEAGCSRAIAHDLVEAGAVQVDGRVERRPAHRVPDDAVVLVDHEPPIEPAVEADAGVLVSVVHADDHLYVVDKPAGLVVHPGSGTDEPTLVHGLLALDPGLAEAQALLGQVNSFRGNWLTAEAHFRAALALDESEATSHNIRAFAVANAGHLREALRESEVAYRLAPAYAGSSVNLMPARVSEFTTTMS